MTEKNPAPDFITISSPPTFPQKIALIFVGVGVVLLSNRPFLNFFRYCGVLWVLGHWALLKQNMFENSQKEEPKTP